MKRSGRSKQAARPLDPFPEVVSDETIAIPRCEVRYTILLNDAQVEQMAAGALPEDVRTRCYGMLGWKRGEI